MGQLVLLVVAAAWAAVLLPPLLRSRVENRPNSSVVDFRRQLNRLQSTVPTRAGGSLRPVGRQLASSPLQRPAAAGRPGDHHARGRVPAARHASAPRTHAARGAYEPGASPRGSVPQNSMSQGSISQGSMSQGSMPQSSMHGAALRSRADATGGHQRAHRQAQVRRPSPALDLRRRRMNVLFMLVLATASTLFLAATTKATVMLYVFALAFLALCGYVYLLSQLRQREQQSWPASWPHEHAVR